MTNHQKFMEQFIGSVAPEIRLLKTEWQYIFWVIAAFDRNVVSSSVAVRPDDAGRRDWPTRSGQKNICNVVLAYQRSLSGAGASGFAVVARIDRQDLETKFFYGNDAEKWMSGTSSKETIMNNAQRLWSA